MTARETRRQDGGNTRRASSRRKAVPRAVQEETLLRLEPEQRRYMDAGVTLSFEFAFRGECLHISTRQNRGGWGGGGLVVSPLCRLRYTGDPEHWHFEIFSYSRNGYDEEQDFPFGGGSPEQCFAVAADFYLLEYDVLEAGSSRERLAGGPEATFQGEAGLLPPLEIPGPVEVPESLSGTAGRPLLEDLDAFLGFVEGRSFDLAPRTLGFRRRELIEVNNFMGQPALLHKRPVQSDAPRVQCCFALAETIGLLRVVRTLHRAESTSEVARFRTLEDRERLWAALEAMWQRVRWATLRPRAFGNADQQQAGRYWLGAELGRSAAPLAFDRHLTGDAEVLEVFLFPFWRDAGLLELTYNGRMAVNPYYGNRSTRLSRVEPNDLGRLAFDRLSELSPGREHLGEMADPADGQWQGREFICRIEGAGTFLRYDPAT